METVSQHETQEINEQILNEQRSAIESADDHLGQTLAHVDFQR